MPSKKKLNHWAFWRKSHEHDDYVMTDEQHWQIECDDAYLSHESFDALYAACVTEAEFDALTEMYLYQAYEGLVVNGVVLKAGHYRTGTALKWMVKDGRYYRKEAEIENKS